MIVKNIFGFFVGKREGLTKEGIIKNQYVKFEDKDKRVGCAHYKGISDGTKNNPTELKDVAISPSYSALYAEQPVITKETASFSAIQILSTWQKIFLFFISQIILIGMLISLEKTFFFLINISNLIYIFLTSFKLYLLVKGVCTKRNNPGIKKSNYRQNNSQELPLYSIITPMYKESEVVEKIIKNILKINYPKEKLQVILVIECDDHETLETLANIDIPNHFSIIRVPLYGPRTKAKACNYALQYVFGKFLTIYDAEDNPDPNQIKEALKVFDENKSVVCVQSVLCYYNAEENWLTRMFEIEYQSLFNHTLPTISAMNLPIPLGGSSNHFDVKTLRDIGGWDDYNVTEDAELGIRIAIQKLKTKIIRTHTKEEAPTTIKPWLKQRARWIKGHLLTYLIYMKKPKTTLNALGGLGFITFTYMLGLAPLALIISPLILSLNFAHLLPLLHLQNNFQTLILISTTFSVVNIAFGIVVLFATAWIAQKKMNLKIQDNDRNSDSDSAEKNNNHSNKLKLKQIFFSLSFCFYFFLHSIASIIALWELIFRPYYWNKTKHGVSKFIKKS
jgi:glycosyltransferase XagB